MRAQPATALSLVLSTAFFTTALFATTALVARDAAADDWRVSRHDGGRTGAATGPTPLASPNVAWRAYVGGFPADFNSRFGVGSPSGIVTSNGGRFVARDSVTQALLWKSAILGPGSVVGAADLDGDNKPEVVVQTASQAHVLDGATGALKWSSPSDEIKIMGAVHVVDMDGDGLADVYLDNGIGANWGTVLAAAYSWKGGTAHKLWGLPVVMTPGMVNAGEDALMDLDGDGTQEVVLASFRAALVVNGTTGATIATLQPPTTPTGNPYFEATALGTELDGQPGKEVLLMQWNSSSAELAPPTLAAYKVDATSGQSQYLWQIDPGTYDSEIVYSADVASDLNGDGVDEIVYSFRNGATWSTQVLAGATGQPIATLADTRFEGAADLDGAPGKELLVSGANGLQVYSLTNGSLVPIGAPLAGLRTLTMEDPATRSAQAVSRRLAIVHGPGDRPMALTGVPVGNPTPYDAVGSFSALQGLELVPNGGSLSLQSVASYTPLVGSITGAMRADFATRPYEQVAVGTNAGLVVVLNQALKATNGLVWINGDAVGAFVGGYGNGAPALAATDALGPFVVFPTTFLGAAIADARLASWIIPPIPRWSQKNLRSPSIVDVDGVASVVGVEDHAVVAHRADTGVVLGSITMPTGRLRGTPVQVRIAGQGKHFVGVDWLVNGGAQVSQTLLDFSSSTTTWTGAPITWAGYFGSSVADLDNDGTDEWYTMESGNLYKRSGATGAASTIASYPNMGYALPMLASFKTAAPEILLQSGWEGPRLVAASDGSNLWPDPAPVEPANAMAGARAVCGGAARFVYPALESAHLHAYDSQSGVLTVEKVYAGGKAYDTDQAAVSAGDRPGALSNVTAIDDLAGAPAALVGSTDGYLYAVDPCTLDVRWAANIGVSLGEPIVADVDGDGDDEIVVSGADGFFYGLDKSWFPAPLVSITGDGGNATFDVKVGDSVTVTWPASTGAQAYEFALVGPDDKPINTPAYQPTSSPTATLPLDGALANRPYRVSVRATGTSGKGTEGFSKAVVVKDVAAPTAKVSTTDGKTFGISFDAADDLALDHFELSVKAGGGATHFVDDGMLKGKQATGSTGFTPDKSYWGQDVTLSVKVFDTAGLTNETTLSAHVDASGVVTAGPGTPISGPPTGDPSGPGGTPTTNAGDSMSGGCAVGSGGASDGLAVGSLLIGLSALRRRRARRAS